MLSFAIQNESRFERFVVSPSWSRDRRLGFREIGRKTNDDMRIVRAVRLARPQQAWNLQKSTKRTKEVFLEGKSLQIGLFDHDPVCTLAAYSSGTFFIRVV